jgi:hypothetical protein
MLHMNKTERYQRLREDLKTIYVCRGTSSAHYIAGLTMGMAISRGLSDPERQRLHMLLSGAANADR